MIYFVTERKEYYKERISKDIFPDILILNSIEGKELYYKILGKRKILAFDIEATGLDAYLLEPILYGFGNKSVQFMFDWTVDIRDIFEHLLKHKTILLGHNLKYDIKIIAVNYNILFTRLYDTMIADQRIWMKTGYGFSYAALVQRYLNKTVLKSTRNDFIDADLSTFKLTTSHLYYLKGDLVDLFDIRTIQQSYIKKYNIPFLVYGIEFPLISVIAEAELTGFEFNVELWRERIKKDKEELYKLKLALDAEVKKLKDFVSLFADDGDISINTLLGGQKYNKERKPSALEDFINTDGTVNQPDLFGNKMTTRAFTGLKKKIDVNVGNINYKSKKDIVFIFAALKEPLITPLETIVVPQLDKNGKLIGSVDNFTIKADLLQKFILLKPNSKMIPFIELIIQHSKLEKALSTYGENFIDKINPKTGKIHTIFRQCDADTGRYQSGGGDKEPDKYNAQNIPRDNAYRNCFTVDTKKYSLATPDYESAELVVMASHAQDFRLIEISKQDMHSYMATKCWKNIYYYRAKRLFDYFSGNLSGKTKELIEEYKKLKDLSQNYIVTKDIKYVRDAFKPMTFGVIYGMYPKKAGATLNIPAEEGKIVIQTIEAEIPDTIKMVKRASAFAKANGYVILETRTNARAWFPNLIKLLRKEINEKDNFYDISNELSAARNIRIQGTQATFLKEAAVVLRKYFKKHKIDAIQLSWVHDEFIIQIPLHLDGQSDEWIEWSKSNSLEHPLSIGETVESLTEVIKIVLQEVANRYLENITIKVDLHVKPYWFK